MTRREISAEVGRVIVLAAFLALAVLATGCRAWLDYQPVSTAEDRARWDQERTNTVLRLDAYRRLRR